MTNMLEVGGEDSPLRRNLLLGDSFEKELEALFPPDRNSVSAPSKPVKPHPGFCVKTKNDNGDKVFINICHTTEIPPPDDIRESDLADILSSDEPSGFRVPMSLGEAHAELDKSGKGCTVYDVAINTTFFEKLQENLLFKTFLLTVTMEGLEDKYGVNLDKNGWIVLKNKKCLGTLQRHNIQQRDKSLIKEMPGGRPSPVEPINEQVPKKPMITELVTPEEEKQSPNFRITKESAEGDPGQLVAVFELPDATSSSDLMLDLGEDRIILDGDKSKYHLDIFIPYLVQTEKCRAQFSKKNRVLTVTMPIQPCCDK